MWIGSRPVTPAESFVAIAVLAAMAPNPAQAEAIASNTQSLQSANAVGVEVMAQAGELIEFDIPAKNLNAAILEFSDRAGVQVFYSAEKLTGLRSSPVSGQLTVESALRQLLAGTGVTYRFDGAEIVRLDVAPAAADDGPLRLAPITVEGDRRFRTLTETPSSVVVVTETELERFPGARTIDEIIDRIPNMTNAGVSDEAPTIRGIRATGPTRGAGAAFGGFRPRGTLVVDGRPLSFWEYGYGGTSIYDIAQIEVFRGPQTTAQGVNAIAGATYIHTEDPSFKFEGGVKAEVGNRQARQLAGFVSGPIVEDQLAVRVTADLRESETYLDFDNDFFDDANDIEARTLRGKLLWEPIALTGFSAQLTVSDTENQNPRNFLVIEPLDDLEARDAEEAGKNELGATTGIVDLAYEFAPGTEMTNRFVYSDFDVALFTEGQPRPNGQTAKFDGTDISNETIVRFDIPDIRLSGLGGLYYSETDQDERFWIISPVAEESTDRKESLGIFAELSYQVTDRLEVTGGLRFQRDSQDREGSLLGVSFDFDESFDEILPKLEVAFNVTDDTRVGVFASKGFNPGGFSLNFATFQPDEYDEETVWNYELYVRSSLLDGRLNLAGNVFFSDWSGFQKFTITSFDPITDAPAGSLDNVDAESYGLEFSADFAVTPQISAYGSVGLLETKFDDLVAPGQTEEFEFANAPGYTFVLGVDFRPIDGLTLSGQVRRTDGYFSDDENDPLNRIDAFTLIDVAARYQVVDGVTAYAFLENVLDEVSATSIFQQAPFGSVSTVTTPRTFGAGLQLRF